MAEGPADDWKRWPGFRADPKAFWVAATRHVKGPLAAGGITRTRCSDNRKKRANEQLAEVAAARRPSRVEIGNRNALEDGETTHPSQHALAQAIRFVRGGRDTLLGFIRRAALNGNADAQSFLSVFDDLLPSNQIRVDLDKVCECAGVTPDLMMGIAVSTAMRLGTDVADMVAATMHPLIVHQTAKSAMRIGGPFAEIAQRDREMMLQNRQFIAAPKGASVNISANVNAAAMAASQPSVPSFAESLSGAMGAQQDMQRRLSAVIDAEPE